MLAGLAAAGPGRAGEQLAHAPKQVRRGRGKIWQCNDVNGDDIIPIIRQIFR